MSSYHTVRRFLPLLVAILVLAPAPTFAKKPKKSKKASEGQTQENPYADYVWPPPPDEARIQLVDVLSQRVDVEADSKLRKVLLGASPDDPYKTLVKPFAVAIDSQGRILVTDTALSALLRFDREGGIMDVFGTQGAQRLAGPLGLGMGPDDTAYVADAGTKKVLAIDAEGTVRAVFGRAGELLNPTDAALSPDGKLLYVTDSKGQKIVVFDAQTAELVDSWGQRGEGDGDFNFPTALSFGPVGDLYVLDQLNARVQLFDPEGGFLDKLGGLGVGFGSFVRPKDVAVDEVGFIYVVDNAFNNFQIFDADFSLLTFVGEGGTQPGQFHGASGIAVRGDQMAVVDQLGRRVQVFRFLVPKGG